MKRILLIGKTGQVGWELHRTLTSVGNVIAPDRNQLELTDADSIRRVIREAGPDVIVNAAGLTSVDQAEMDPELAMQVNGVAPGILAEEAKRVHALLIHYSTTFVFDGTKTEPYVESDIPKPINAYGTSKLAGEKAIASIDGKHIILRASWTYSHRRINFPLTILQLERAQKEIPVVVDQIAAPTWARTYAEATAVLLNRGNGVSSHSGIYHLSAAGQTTRYQWARKITEMAQEFSGIKAPPTKLRPIKTAEFPHPAGKPQIPPPPQRPLYTVMDNSKIKRIFEIQMRPWEDQLLSFLSDLTDTAQAKGIDSIR